MAEEYDHKAIEKKWQKYWDEKGLLKADFHPKGGNRYFPPSG